MHLNVKIPEPKNNFGFFKLLLNFLNAIFEYITLKQKKYKKYLNIYKNIFTNIKIYTILKLNLTSKQYFCDLLLGSLFIIIFY